MKAKIGMHLMGGPYYMPDALNDIYLDISKLFATEWVSYNLKEHIMRQLLSMTSIQASPN